MRVDAVDQLGDPADRPGRRHRLLAVLPAPRARGARARALERRRAADRRGDLRPGRAVLRLRRDDRDGRHVPDGLADVRVVRRRHRPGGGDRARSARSPSCRPCCPSSATGSSAAGSRSSRAARARTASRASGARSSAPCCATRSSSAARRPPLLVALAIPAFSLHTVDSGAQGLPRDLPVMQVYDRIQKAFPGGAGPAVVVVSARDVTAPQVTAGIAALRRAALATGQMHEPISVEVSASRRAARVLDPARRQGHRRGLQPRARHAAPARSSPPRSARCPASSAQRHRLDRRLHRTSTTR